MGGSYYDAGDYSRYATTVKQTINTQGRQAVFKQVGCHADMEPKGLKFREAFDNAANPNSTPIIIGLDVTGSMGDIPEYMIKEGLGVLFTSILDRNPVTNPQILLAGIGDVDCDRAPVQIGQFEADNGITQWLEKMYLEGGGGGNGKESYEMMYYFAAYHTKCDASIKRNQKGFIFTIGDDNPNSIIDRKHVEKVFGYKPEADIPFIDLMTKVRQSWIPYHIIPTRTSNLFGGSSAYGQMKKNWSQYLGENVVELDDYTKLSELITSLLEMHAGKTAAQVTQSWSGSTAVTIGNALNGLTTQQASKGVMKF